MPENILSGLLGFKVSTTPYRKMISEAKDAGFAFRVHIGDEIYDVSAQNVNIESDKIGLTTTEGTILNFSLSHLREVIVLPSSKTINLIVKQTLKDILYYIIPMAVGYALFISSSLLSSVFGLSKDSIEGFGFGVIVVSYIAYFASIKYYQRSAESIRLHAVTSTSPLIRQLEEVSKKGEEEEYFTKLIHGNLKNIEEYYTLVKQQTEKSYQLARFGVVAGFVVLVAGIALSFKGLNPTTVLTIASGTLIEFISAVFFYLYNKTVQQLNVYHDKLIDVQDTMLALKVAEGIKDDQKLKNDTMMYLTKTLTSRLHESETK